MADASFKKVIRGKLKLKKTKPAYNAESVTSSHKRTRSDPSAATEGTRPDEALHSSTKSARRGSLEADSAAAPPAGAGEVVAVLHYEDEHDLKQKRLAAEDQAFHTYSSQGGKVMRYRVKSKTAFGSYKVVEQAISQPMSRSELLNKRSKHKSDRMCM